MARYISGTYTSTYTLTTNPTTITSAGLIDANNADAIFGSSAAAWQLTNLGTIQSTGTSGDGVLFEAGGSLTNGQSGGTGGLIQGGGTGILIAGSAGTVVNFGSVVSTGTNSSAVYLGAGGGATNGVSGSTTALIQGAGDGVQLRNVAGTVVNFGTIAHTGAGTSGEAIYLGAGGTVTNYGLIIGARPAMPASYQGVITIHNQYATIRNFGTISPTNVDNGINLDHGGTIINGATSATGALISGSEAGVYVGGKSNVAYGAGAIGTIVNYGTIQGTAASVKLVSGGAVVNAGTIESTGISAGVGVYFGNGGVLTNQAGGLITSGLDGISLHGSAGTVANYGTVTTTSTTNPAVYVGSGGVVTNRGLITGGVDAISLHNTAGTVLNFGAVNATGTQRGVYLGAGGLITNEAGGLIGAPRRAIALGGTTSAAATVTNFGNIAGSVGISINAADTGSNTIINFGTIAGTGGTAISLGTVGNELVVIGSTNSSLQGVVANLQPGDRIDLPFLTFGSGGSYTLNPITHVLQVTESGTSFNIALDPNESFAGDVFQLGSDAGTGTLVTELPCFCRGTLILTERGEVAVEALAIGDRVVTLSGVARPIKWIGHRSYDGRFAFGQRQILPVCVTAGALGDGRPWRDLWVSPNHALYLEGVLIEARDLVNGVSVVQAERVERVEYFHIELDSHDLVVAQGAAAESFLDDDSRGLFHNAHEYRALYPGERSITARYCAPRRDQGWEVERARAMIARRAGLPVTAEAAPPGLLRA